MLYQNHLQFCHGFNNHPINIRFIWSLFVSSVRCSWCFLAVCFFAYHHRSPSRLANHAATWPPFLFRIFVTLSATPRVKNVTTAMFRLRHDHRPGCTTSWPQTMASLVSLESRRNGPLGIRGTTTGPVPFRTPRTRKSSRACCCHVSPMARPNLSWVKPRRVGLAIESLLNTPRAMHRALPMLPSPPSCLVSPHATECASTGSDHPSKSSAAVS